MNIKEVEIYLAGKTTGDLIVAVLSASLITVVTLLGFFLSSIVLSNMLFRHCSACTSEQSSSSLKISASIDANTSKGEIEQNMLNEEEVISSSHSVLSMNNM